MPACVCARAHFSPLMLNADVLKALNSNSSCSNEWEFMNPRHVLPWWLQGSSYMRFKTMLPLQLTALEPRSNALGWGAAAPCSSDTAADWPCTNDAREQSQQSGCMWNKGGKHHGIRMTFWLHQHQTATSCSPRLPWASDLGRSKAANQSFQAAKITRQRGLQMWLNVKRKWTVRDRNSHFPDYLEYLL